MLSEMYMSGDYTNNSIWFTIACSHQVYTIFLVYKISSNHEGRFANIDYCYLVFKDKYV